MKIDNKKRAGKIKLFFMAVPFVIIAGTALVFLFTDIKHFEWMALPLLALILFFTVMFYFRYNFVSVYAGPDKVLVRYKSLSPFITPNNSVKINAKDFHQYNIVSRLNGKKKLLYLYQDSPGGIAKYPGISISALSDAEIQQIKKAFDLIITLNQKQK